MRPLFQEAVLRAYRPSFSPGGKLLAFMVETVGRNNDMWIMNADGTGAMPVSSDPGPKEGGDTWNLSGTGLLYTYFDGPRIEFRRYDTVAKRMTSLIRGLRSKN
jgi:Tol biopolymer transport system component